MRITLAMPVRDGRDFLIAFSVRNQGRQVWHETTMRPGERDPVLAEHPQPPAVDRGLTGRPAIPVEVTLYGVLIGGTALLLLLLVDPKLFALVQAPLLLLLPLVALKRLDRGLVTALLLLLLADFFVALVAFTQWLASI
jgi:hypothetical protein